MSGENTGEKRDKTMWWRARKTGGTTRASCGCAHNAKNPTLPRLRGTGQKEKGRIMKRVLFALFGLLLSVPAHAAALPSGYTELTYVNMPEGSYLLTDIVPTFAGHYELEMQTTSVTANAATYLGARDESSGNGGLRFAHISDKTFRIAGFGALSTSSGTAANNTKYKFIWDNGSFWVYSGTTLIHSGTFTEETMPTTTPLTINGWNSGGTIGGNIEEIYLYSFKGWNNQGQLVADMIPAKYGNTVGLYDIVRNRFFENSGSGSFLPGEELSPCRNLLDPSTFGNYGIKTDGTTQGSATYKGTDFIAVSPNTTYTYSNFGDLSGLFSHRGIQYDANKQKVSTIPSSSAENYTFTTDSNTRYIRLTIGTSAEIAEAQLERGTTATPYVPYDAQCGGCSGGGTRRNYVSATGTGTQVGTPTPENPIDPVFFRQGDMILRAVGDYKDTFDATTGKITRNVGVKVLDGTEDWIITSSLLSNMYNLSVPDLFAENTSVVSNRATPYCTHFKRSTNWVSSNNRNNYIQAMSSSQDKVIGLGYSVVNEANLDTFKSWLAAQYAAGTPVTIYYPLAEPVVEDWDGGATYCEKGIKIATNLYNSAKFQNVIDALDTAVSTINNIVAGTIAQANSIGELASGKQTRPNPADSSDTTCPTSCPNYRQCLLVEKDDGTPCWYEISDPFRDFVAPIIGTNTAPASTTNNAGYTQLEYIESTGTQYINTGIRNADIDEYYVKFKATYGVYKFIFGNYVSESTECTRLLFTSTDDNRMYSNVGSPADSPNIAVGVISNDWNEAWSKRSDNTTYFKLNTGEVQSRDVSAGNANSKTIGLFVNAISGNKSVATIARMQFKKNGTLVRDFVPVLNNATGKYGMYDKVHGVFYPNAATSGDDFTPGPEVLDQDPAIPGMVWTATWTGGSGVTAGTVNGVARCTSVAGTNNYLTTNPTLFSQLSSANQTAWGTAFDASTVGDYKQCWCKVDNATTSGETVNPMGSTEWVFLGTGNSATYCSSSCAGDCAYGIRNALTFRATVLGM